MKTKKEISKKLKSYMQKRYQQILKYLLSDAPNASIDVELLIKHEPHFYKTIQQIQLAIDIETQENLFNKNVDMKILDSERYLADTQNQMILVSEALDRTKNMKALTPKSIKYKNGRIRNLEKRLETLHITQNKLIKLNAELIPPKKVGRPKKNSVKDEDIYEEE